MAHQQWRQQLTLTVKTCLHSTPKCMQVIGFVVLVAGTSMYNELLRGCLPGVPPPVSEEASLEVCCTAPPLLAVNTVHVHLCMLRRAANWLKRQPLHQC